MKAGQLTGPRRMELVDVAQPTPKEGEALVRLEKISICGSDIRPFAAVMDEESYPLHPGRPTHECVGVVEESLCEEFNVGQRVIAFPYSEGGFREYLAVPPASLVALPDEGPLDAWIMCQPMGTVLYSVSRIGDVIDKNVVVLGQGAIGLSFTTFLSGMNCRELIAVDLEDYRLDMSRKLGATRTINGRREDAVEAVMELTGGVGPDVVVEAAGEHDTVRQSVVMAKKFGTVIWFGMTHNEYFAIDFQQIRNKDLTMIGTSSARAGTMPRYVKQVVHMMDQGRIDPSVLVTHRMKAEAAQEAFTMYEERSDNIIKVVIDL